MKYKKTIVIVFVLMIFVLLISQYHSSHFYKVNNITFTVWKKTWSSVYITPYKYKGFFHPKQDYIETSACDFLTICLENDSSLIIFNSGYEANRFIKCNFTNYKYKLFINKNETVEDVGNYYKSRKKSMDKYPFFDIYIKEMTAYTSK
jgi:hypothetical protein